MQKLIPSGEMDVFTRDDEQVVQTQEYTKL